MKAPILILLCTLSLFTSTGFCNDSLEFTLTEMDISLLERWKQGELEGILRIEQGEKLPFTLTVEGSVLALRDPPKPFLVEALQRVYIKIDKNIYAFSSDKTHWKPFEEYFGGEIGVSTGVNNEAGPFGSFYVKMHLK